MSSRIACLPASIALMSRCVCSSNSSRFLSNHSPARPCASVASCCAFSANSLPFAVRRSRVSRPVLGATSNAAAAPSAAPRKNHPRYPAAEPSSAIVASSMLANPVDEHVQSLSDRGRGPDDLPDPREAAHGGHEPRRPFGEIADALGDRAEAFELPVALSHEGPQVLREPLGLGGERTDLALEQHQDSLGALQRAPERNDGRDQEDQDRGCRDETQRDESLHPGAHPSSEEGSAPLPSLPPVWGAERFAGLGPRTAQATT